MEGTKRTCLVCKREFGEAVRHKGYGMCARCYLRAWHAAHPNYDRERKAVLRWERNQERKP